MHRCQREVNGRFSSTLVTLLVGNPAPDCATYFVMRDQQEGSGCYLLWPKLTTANSVTACYMYASEQSEHTAASATPTLPFVVYNDNCVNSLITHASTHSPLAQLWPLNYHLSPKTNHLPSRTVSTSANLATTTSPKHGLCPPATSSPCPLLDRSSAAVPRLGRATGDRATNEVVAGGDIRRQADRTVAAGAAAAAARPPPSGHT